MKSVLISIRPKWVEKIASGQKTIEVRKSAPQEVPFKAYLYCTNGEYSPTNCGKKSISDCLILNRNVVNGKVIGEFICDKVDEYNFHEGLIEFNSMGLPSRIYGSYFIFADDYESMCLSYDEVKNYGKGKTLYGWHISDLKIYDKPRALSEFCIPCKVSCENCKNPLYFECWCEEKGKKIVTRPPQSYMFVEEVEQ